MTRSELDEETPLRDGVADAVGTSASASGRCIWLQDSSHQLYRLRLGYARASGDGFLFEDWNFNSLQGLEAITLEAERFHRQSQLDKWIPGGSPRALCKRARPGT